MIRVSSARDHVQGTDAIATLATEAWLARAIDPKARITVEHVEAARRKKLDLDSLPDAVNIDLMTGENYKKFRNALSSEKGASGGFVSPEVGFVAPWEEALLALPMRSLATTIRPEAGNVYREPTTDDSSNEGIILAENGTSTAQDVAWGQVIHKPTKFHSGRVLVPNELLEDGTNFAPQLARLLGNRVARLQNRKFTLGTGVSEPMGVVNACIAAGATYPAASASAIAGDDVWNLMGVVESGRIDPERCVFMMNRATLVALLKLKSAGGDYLIFDRSSFKLNGFPIRLNYHLASTIASGNCSVLFGDFSSYHVCDFGGVRLMRDRESHAEADQIAWGALQRSSGNLVDAGQHPIAALIH